MKKVLLVIVVIFGFGVLAIAGLVMIRVLGTRKSPTIAATEPTAAPNNQVSYADLFNNDEGGDGTATDESTDGTADAAAEETPAEADSATSEASMSTDPMQDEDLLLGTAPQSAKAAPKERRSNWGGGMVTRNDHPVGHKNFRAGRKTRRTTTNSSFTSTSSSDTFDDFDTGSSSSSSMDTSASAATSTDTGGGLDDGFGDPFDDAGGSSASSGGGDGFDLGDTGDSGASTTTTAAASGGDSGGGGGDDPFAEFFDESASGGGDTGASSGGGGGSAPDPFAATGGGGASQSFKVAATGPAVRKVSHSRSGGLTEVRVELANTSQLPQYRVFPMRASRGKPARIMIDFESTAVGAGPPVAGDGALISQIKVMNKKGASAPIGRVMVELTADNPKPPPVDWREEKGSLVVIIGGTNRLGQGREFPRRD